MLSIRGGRWLGLVLALLLWGCQGGSIGRVKAPSPPRIVDVFRIVAVDWAGNAISGARVRMTPIWGTPEGGGNGTTDHWGSIEFRWRPQVADRLVGLRTADQVKYYSSQATYRVDKQGYLPRAGTATLLDVYHYFANPRLRSMNRRPASKFREIVVRLYRPRQYLGRLAKGRILRARLLRFLSDFTPRLLAYGLEFDRPAFDLVNRDGRGVFVVRLVKVHDVRSARMKVADPAGGAGAKRWAFGVDGAFVGGLLLTAVDPILLHLFRRLDSSSVKAYSARVALRVYDPDRPGRAAKPVRLSFLINRRDLEVRSRGGFDQRAVVKAYRYYWDDLAVDPSQVAAPDWDPVVRDSWWGIDLRRSSGRPSPGK